jgi:REP element-mobilizing transposase RayT
MILAHHSIFSAYGFWLPNDPRGSWSDFVRRWELIRFGKATKATTHRSLARDEHDQEVRRKAKHALRYEPVRFTGLQARSIGRGFAKAAGESGYKILACAILPEHVHTVILRTDRSIERIIGHLKTRATQRLSADGLHPLANCSSGTAAPPSPWGRKAWHVFLDDREDIARAVDYVRQNPVKDGKPPQHWSFVSSINV